MTKENDAVEDQVNYDQVDEVPVEEVIVEGNETVNDNNTSDSKQSELEKANERIAELEQLLAESENKTYRVLADFENYKRRVKLDQEVAEKYRAQSLVSNLLSALDNFERAMKVDVDDDKTKSLLQGMDMVYRGLIDALKSEGVEVIEAVGKQFDPQIHQAVMQVEDAEFESNTIIEEFQKGYKLKDRVIRPSMVKVNQ
ncbi:nucleotide exchange factor GrpE [Cytobacillus sp. S13-E01]|uniref:nucleotide exchange factor GrpE n=1 Tax=Cytobacillus sp. S13-E01 TaxID=3031326 RepID=UPI0023D7D5C6|nr:nucleotide exchange factor GrpE [Cytobacillus sp. S13-E01]MDF0727231.1 nucleotide exchange factor GrpE [Cytobacillus sp. S13-E01]